RLCRSKGRVTGPLCGGSLMRMPAAGSRSVITSQKLIFVVTPTPSGVGQVISGASFFSTGGGGAAGFRAGRRVCTESGIARQSMNRTIRIQLLRRCRTRSEVGVEKIFDAMPCVAEHVLAREVMELARVRHEGNKVAFLVLQQLIDQPHGVEVRNVNVRGAMEH